MHLARTIVSLGATLALAALTITPALADGTTGARAMRAPRLETVVRPPDPTVARLVNGRAATLANQTIWLNKCTGGCTVTYSQP